MTDEQVVDESAGPAHGARRGPAGVRVVWWAAAVVVVVVVAVVAVWIAASDGTSGTDRSLTPGTVATDHRVAVTFDDRGLHAQPASVNAGIIQFAFADKRTKPTGSAVLLYYEVQPGFGGDLITGVGGSVRVLLCAHRWYLAASIDGTVTARVALAVGGKSADCPPGT